MPVRKRFCSQFNKLVNIFFILVLHKICYNYVIHTNLNKIENVLDENCEQIEIQEAKLMVLLLFFY